MGCRHDWMSLLECVSYWMTAQWGGIKFESFGLERTVTYVAASSGLWSKGEILHNTADAQHLCMFSNELGVGVKTKAWVGLRLLQRRVGFPFCYCWWYRSPIRFDLMTWPSLHKKRRKSLKIALTGHFFWLFSQRSLGELSPEFIT